MNGDTADATTEACPMCGSLFGTRKYQLEECVECSAEASTACCIQDKICIHCNQD